MLKKQYLKSKPVCKVTFSFPKELAGTAEELRILGDFNNWSWEEGVVMKSKKEAFEAVLPLETGRNYEFRYLSEKGIWMNDDAADAYLPSPYYGIDNSVVTVEAKKAAEPAPKKKVAAKPKAAAPTATKKTKKAKAKKDDLKKIEGIGPKIAKLLNEAGIVTFSDLAKAKLTTLEGVLKEAGSRYKMHDPTTWSEQAALAAADKWDTLATLQEQLKGGKRK